MKSKLWKLDVIRTLLHNTALQINPNVLTQTKNTVTQCARVS